MKRQRTLTPTALATGTAGNNNLDHFSAHPYAPSAPPGPWRTGAGADDRQSTPTELFVISAPTEIVSCNSRASEQGNFTRGRARRQSGLEVTVVEMVECGYHATASRADEAEVVVFRKSIPFRSAPLQDLFTLLEPLFFKSLSPVTNHVPQESTLVHS